MLLSFSNEIILVLALWARQARCHWVLCIWETMDISAFNIPQNSAGSSSWKRNKILALGVSGPCKRHAPIISFVRLDVQRMNLVMWWTRNELITAWETSCLDSKLKDKPYFPPLQIFPNLNTLKSHFTDVLQSLPLPVEKRALFKTH